VEPNEIISSITVENEFKTNCQLNTKITQIKVPKTQH
jgi:hypothetical protein